jgi:hypothetical protein
MDAVVNMDRTMVDAPLVSVIIPVHNGAKTLGETLVSLYVQSYSNLEIIVVDDASTDALEAALKSHVDRRLRVLRLSRNVGVSAARNAGVDAATGSFIAFCDADDICLASRIEKQLSFLQANRETGLCGSAFTCFDTRERETVRNPGSNNEIRKALMRGNSFGLSTVMCRAEVLRGYHFNDSLHVAEDYELWTRLIAAGVQVANLQESLVRYRLHETQASNRGGDKLDEISGRLRSLYCASLLGDKELMHAIETVSIESELLDYAARQVQTFVASSTGFELRDFRFMLAWIYAKAGAPSIRRWWGWHRIQCALSLELDANYRFNTALLAVLPLRLQEKYQQRLLKLKR